MAPLSLIPQIGSPGPLLLAVLASYLLGSVPFGLLLTRVLKGEDLRQLGSGNIGATNTMRALGRGWGLYCREFLSPSTAPRAGLRWS